MKNERTLTNFVTFVQRKKLNKYFDELLGGICVFEEVKRLAMLGDNSINTITFLGMSVRMYLCMKILQDLSESIRLPENVRRELRRLPDRFKRHVLHTLAGCTTLSRLSQVKAIVDQLYSWVKEALKTLGFQVMEFRARTVTRTIVGRPSPPVSYLFEMGTRLHPLLGIPYIPASSLKGAFRSYATLRGLSCDGVTIDEIAGTTEKCGGIVFVDAYPVDGRILIEPEVTTSIYRSNGSEIHEEHRAVSVPVLYPSIARNVVFKIVIGLRPSRISKECRKVLLQWISETLREGIGAKTMLGYGMLITESEVSGT